MLNLWRTKTQIVAIDKWEPNCWVQITCPSDEDANFLLNDLNIPDYFLADISDTDERARVEMEEGWTMIILRIPYIKEDEETRSPFTTVPLGIILKKDICITVCHYVTNMMDDFLTHYRRKNKGFTDAVDMIFRLFLSSSVWYLKLLKQMHFQIERAKHDLDKSIDNKDLISLSHLQNSLTYFITSIRGNNTLLSQVKFKLPVDELDADLIEDVNIEMRQASETASIYSNILNSMMDTYANVINNNMSSVMKLLTSISIILMFPTLIASIYGMNVKNGLEDTPYGMPFILVLSAVITGLFVWYFHKQRWI